MLQWVYDYFLQLHRGSDTQRVARFQAGLDGCNLNRENQTDLQNQPKEAAWFGFPISFHIAQQYPSLWTHPKFKKIRKRRG